MNDPFFLTKSRTSELRQYEILRDMVGTALAMARRSAKCQSSTSPIHTKGIVFDDAAGSLWDLLAELEPTIRQLEEEEREEARDD
jgi:myo-inositol-hexaphosphate 3-phosphohydrolase